MIILLYGEDDFRRNERKNSIVREFLKKNPAWSYKSFDLETDDLDLVRDFLEQTSLFGEKKLALLENLDLKEGKKFLKSKISDSHSLLLSIKNKPTKDFKFLLEDPVVSEEFKVLIEAEWLSFLSKRSASLGINFSPDALRFFASVYEKDAWSAATELEKLSLLGKKEIGLKDLADLGLEISPDFWATLRRLTDKNIKNRLWALGKLNSQNEPAGKTFNVISSFWAEKTPQFAEYDSKIKSGELEYEEALLDIALS